MAESKALSSTEKMLQERVNKAQATLASDTGNIIKLSRQGFKYQDGETMSFHAIVLGSVFENVYYDRPYDPEAGLVDPLCFAVNPESAKLAPPEGHTHPQSDLCDKCEFNEFGSKGSGKACRNGRRVAVVAVPDPDDLSTVDLSEIAILRIAPTSLAPYGKYETHVFRTMGIDPIQLVTNFTIDESVMYGKINIPEVVGMYDNPDLLGKLVKIDVTSMLMDVGYSLTPEPYVPPKTAARRSKLS